VLRPLHTIFDKINYPDLLVGLEAGDDAAIFKVNEHTAIIHTLDFFTPIVDDPYTFGAIAAANAMSDVYAMGGEVQLALNICGFPSDLPVEIMSEILRGGAEKVKEAGGVLAGGHTIIDKEPKYGLAVVGSVHPNRILAKEGANPGDFLVITKPLGVGIITTALKENKVNISHLKLAVNNMKSLNREASQALLRVGITACTDITGFALLGHCYELTEKSKVGIELYLHKLPLLDGARDYAKKKFFPGGSCRNERHYQHHVNFDAAIPDEVKMLLYTPETSGGLLATVPKKSQQVLEQEFLKAKIPYWIIGQVVEGSGLQVFS
jgi:selenide,water dikinase